MPSTYFDTVNDRLDSLKEDNRCISETVDKIHETVTEHTRVLADLGRGQVEVRAGQAALGKRVDGFVGRLLALEVDSRRHADSLDMHTDILDRHTEMLTELLDRLPPRAS